MGKKGVKNPKIRYGDREVSRRQFLTGTSIVVGGVALAGLGVFPACKTEGDISPTTTLPIGGSILPTFPAPVVAPIKQATDIKLLKASPERGPAGTTITLTGDGLPPGKTAEIVWVTVDTRYEVTEAVSRDILGVQYAGRVWSTSRVPLGTASIDADGVVIATLNAPSDHGEVHDIYLTVDGVDVAKGGYRLMRGFEMSPMEGPVGTVITIKVSELGSKLWESTAALLYDNKYMGFISAHTTRGTAEFQIRATGPVGKHYISVHPASHGAPFLNIKTGSTSTRHLLPYEEVFTVTEDNGPPEPRVEFPSRSDVAVNDGKHVPAMGDIVNAPGVSANASPDRTPVLAKTTVTASGLSAGTADIVWVTRKRGGATEVYEPTAEEPIIASATVSSGGTIETDVTIPEGVGGWHVVKVVQNGEVVAIIPYYVEQSLVYPDPIRVKVGEKFTVWFKGGGWTELDNGAAVVYDNAYVGYVCGYAYRGVTPVELVATGEPGTHLLDIYPYIYGGGHGDWPWQYNFPQLTALKDHPGLGLGYNFPIYRVAIEVYE
jgi:hypothetical protein